MGDGENRWVMEGSSGEELGGEEIKGLRRGEEGDCPRQGADAEGGMGICPRLSGAGTRLGAGPATDITEKFRNSEHLPWTWLFARCPDDREDRIWKVVIHKGLLKAWVVRTVLIVMQKPA